MEDSRTTSSSETLLRFDEPEGARAVVLEDDGKTAYAYLLKSDEVVSDVWLYNAMATPDTVDWKDRSQMPFPNPKRFCADAPSPRLKTSCVRCLWTDKGVDVSLDGVLVARLEDGAKPGWSRFAAKAGPLAKPLIDDLQS